MNRRISAFLCLIQLLAGSASAFAEEFKIEFKATGNTASVIMLKVEADSAQTRIGDEVEDFNLADQSWLDAGSGKWISLVQCQQWAAQSKARSLKSIESAPEHMRAFLAWSLDPKFTVERAADTLRLISGQVDYVIEGKASAANSENYFRYGELNAYKKAMTERKLPPFAELMVIEEMRKLGYIPRKMTVTMPGIPNAPKIEVEISEMKPRG